MAEERSGEAVKNYRQKKAWKVVKELTKKEPTSFGLIALYSDGRLSQVLGRSVYQAEEGRASDRASGRQEAARYAPAGEFVCAYLTTYQPERGERCFHSR